MSRPTLLKLCGLDAKELIGVPHEKALQVKLNFLTREKSKQADRRNYMYRNLNASPEEVAYVTSLITYLDKAIKATNDDLMEVLA